jgi:cytochrome bd ubiquinol oxidase subunit I
VALTFAVGAVSGTALSFELGLLWPRFMEAAGGVLGPAFALEGYAFFIEAIFLGLYLYGWDRLSPIAHWWTGVAIAVSGLISGILVVAANAWMQTPVGIEAALVLAARRRGAPFPWPTTAGGVPGAGVVPDGAPLVAVVLHGHRVRRGGVYALGLLRGRNNAYHRSGLTWRWRWAGRRRCSSRSPATSAPASWPSISPPSWRRPRGTGRPWPARR